MLRLIMIVGTGSFIGGVARFLTSRVVHNLSITSGSFPFATFIVNITGCSLIGLFYGLAERGHIMNDEWRMLLF